MTLPLEVVAPNLKRRLSGVTSTIIRLVPVQASMIGIRSTGPGLPASVPAISLWRAAFMPRDRWRVWHARRNTEMLLGLVLRYVLFRKYRLLFTSAAQRDHSRYTKWLIGQMDAVVATSAKAAQYLDRPAKVIHHGIDLRSFTPPADRGALRRKYGLPDGPLIGCYGRIRAQKGTGDFLAAMKIVLRRHPNATAIVMGRATEAHQGYLEALKSDVVSEGMEENFLFFPEQPTDQMSERFGMLDLYVAPQRWEGFGLTPLEAMSCGVPVVATRVGAFEELLDPPHTGTLVTPEAPERLAAAISAWLDDPAALEHAGKVAREHVLTHHSIEVEARRLVEVYREMLT